MFFTNHANAVSYGLAEKQSYPVSCGMFIIWLCSPQTLLIFVSLRDLGIIGLSAVLMFRFDRKKPMTATLSASAVDTPSDR